MTLTLRNKIGLYLLAPDELFEHSETKLGKDFLTHISVIVIGVIIAYVLSFVKGISASLSNFFLQSNILDIVIIALNLLVLSIILSGVVHLFAKIFRGDGGYADTFKVYSFAMTPVILLGLPSLVLVDGLYTLIIPALLLLLSARVMVIGLNDLHVSTIMLPAMIVPYLLIYILLFFLTTKLLFLSIRGI